jgi:pSer/pThr/pTyr-binding forkhead associated (FHA) protein
MPTYQLIMRAGPTPGKIFPVEGDDVSIGREPGNSIVINDAEISRRHSHIQLRNGVYTAEDLGSTNGTFINGIRLTGPHALKPGDELSFGEKIKLIFESIEPFDPNATVVSAPAVRPFATPSPAAESIAPPPPPPVVAPEPAYTPSTSDGYAGKIPAQMPGDENNPSKSPTARLVLILVGILILCIVCACISALLWIDANFLWCDFFPFLFGDACG